MRSLELPCPIERLAILHLNLALLSTGKELGEAASDKECCQPILYYHHDASLPSSGPGEAIQFTGVCTALYNLPTTLHQLSSSSDADGEFDPTQTVHLDRSTLVFVPLEEENANSGHLKPMIICVAQISRDAASPLAIRKSIQRCHNLFCILRGGGIHERLCQQESYANTNTNQHQCPYPGMDQLYAKLKAMRKLQETIRRSRDVESHLELKQKDLSEQLQSLRATLPLSAVVEELEFHYDALVADFALFTSRGGKAGSCLVECVPPTIPATERSFWAPGCPPPDTTANLNQAIQDVISESPNLLAVSTFFQKQILFHHDQDATFFREKNPAASLLMAYFASYSFKVKQLREAQQPSATSSPQRRISQGLVSLSDQTFVHTNATNGFLEPPPLGMLNIADQQTTILGPNDDLVWAPLIYFKAIREDGGHYMAHAVFYEHHDFSFLFFFHPGLMQPSEELEVGADVLLRKVSEALMECLNLHVGAISQSRNKPKDTIVKCLQVAGQDVVYVDRTSSETKLFPRVSTNLPPASPKRFLDVFRPSKSTEQESQTHEAEDASVWASEGMDCRHWLASRLPSEALRAFDDAFLTVHRWRQRESQPLSGIIDGSYEMLTPISQGWVYACADQERELYILLDKQAFATLADAHEQSQQVRKGLMPA